MGEFRGQALEDEYCKILVELSNLNAALTCQIAWHLEQRPDAETLECLFDATDRIIKILADDFGITREEINGKA
jgi:hypothetical protein